MYQFSYLEMAEDSGENTRAIERKALSFSIELLKIAMAAGPDSRAAIEALIFVRKLWTVLIEDLAKPENALGAELRAKIISVGLWILREVENIRQGKSQNYRGLLDVSEIIHAGLT